jgi:hypothetical protein
MGFAMLSRHTRPEPPVEPEVVAKEVKVPATEPKKTKAYNKKEE